MGLADYIRSKKVSKIVDNNDTSLDAKVLATKYAAKKLLKGKRVSSSIEKYMLKKSDFNGKKEIRKGMTVFTEKNYSIKSLKDIIQEKKYIGKRNARTVIGGISGGLTTAAYLSMHSAALMSFVFAPVFAVPAYLMPKLKKYKF